jgi:hypothetical protein
MVEKEKKQKIAWVMHCKIHREISKRLVIWSFPFFLNFNASGNFPRDFYPREREISIASVSAIVGARIAIFPS